MVDKSPDSIPKREYPKFFEKSIPIAIGILVVIIIGMLLFAIGVILGVFSGI
jgi:tetrahydromethanopterin S-methyltransferase subunit G